MKSLFVTADECESVCVNCVVSNGAFIDSLIGVLYEATKDPLCGDYVCLSVCFSVCDLISATKKSAKFL